MGVSYSLVPPPSVVDGDDCQEFTVTAILLLCLSVVLGMTVAYYCIADCMNGSTAAEEGADRENTQTLMKNCYTRAPDPEMA